MCQTDDPHKTHTHTHSHADNRTEIFQIHTADTPEGINMAENSALSLTQGERESKEERGFVLGVAVWLWGSIGLTSRGLGLWSRKRHRQEVRAGQNSLEMLYHHYQQGTVSHQGRKKLRGLRGCVCLSLCRAGICLCECMNCA